MTAYAPKSIEDVAQVVASAAASREPLEILGNGSKRGIGRPVSAVHTLSTGNLGGMTLYEPEELILSVRAGTSLAEIEALLEENNQQLAFEPPHWGEQTIGGVIAAGFSGPRRVQAGAARDHLLGFTAVNGRGEIFKSGARVVKNVTGYDLSKLMAGSFGTLAVLTDLTLKVLPRPEAQVTLFRQGQSAREGGAMLRKALGMPFDVSGAAWVPNFNGESLTALRLEGFADSVADRAASLARALSVSVAETGFDDFWQMMRDVRFVETASVLWRISVPPACAADIMDAIPDAETVLDWGGGLVWLGMQEGGDCEAARLRGLMAKTGGHATLIRASETLRAKIDVFQPLPAPLAALTARVKDSFDPLRIFNPGRMYLGL
jgi:glycolate oxidase FAD binding subunit